MALILSLVQRDESVVTVNQRSDSRRDWVFRYLTVHGFTAAANFQMTHSTKEPGHLLPSNFVLYISHFCTLPVLYCTIL